MATLDGTNLGTVNNESIKKSAGLLVLSIPRGDETDTEVEDVIGRTQTIVVLGRRVLSGAEVKSTIITTFLGLMPVEQDATVSYVSDVSGTFNVFVQDIEIENESANTQSFGYTIRLVLGQ